MKDYLKYLGLSLVSLVIFAIAIRFNFVLGFYGVILLGIILATFTKRSADGFAFILWVYSSTLTITIISLELDELKSAQPDKFYLTLGIAIVIVVIAFHPLCYGAGKLIARLANKAWKAIISYY